MLILPVVSGREDVIVSVVLSIEIRTVRGVLYLNLLAVVGAATRHGNELIRLSTPISNE